MYLECFLYQEGLGVEPAFLLPPSVGEGGLGLGCSGMDRGSLQALGQRK